MQPVLSHVEARRITFLPDRGHTAGHPACAEHSRGVWRSGLLPFDKLRAAPLCLASGRASAHHAGPLRPHRHRSRDYHHS